MDGVECTSNRHGHDFMLGCLTAVILSLVIVAIVSLVAWQFL